MKLIIVDGLDGSGKSTVARWMAAHYESMGETTLIRNHPSEGAWGRVSKGMLLKEGKPALLVAIVFFIMDVLSSVRHLRRNWAGYDNVIFVRYLMTTCYLPRGLVVPGYKFFEALLPRGDLKVLVDIDPNVAYRRIAGRAEDMEMFENMDSLQKVRSKMALVTVGWQMIDNSADEASTRKALRSILGH